MFKLSPRELRQCACGKVKGRYIDNMRAEVNGEGVSVAIGNGALEGAIHQMRRFSDLIGQEADRDDFMQGGSGLISYAWARPHEGKGNPHTFINKDL